MTALGRVYNRESALWYGDYRELQLTTTKYAFARGDLIVTVNNDGNPAAFDVAGEGSYTGALTGATATAENGRLRLEIPGDSGEIWIPQGDGRPRYEPVRQKIEVPKPAPKPAEAAQGAPAVAVPDKPFDEMSVEELQAAILAKMAANGPLTDRMQREVRENTHRGSLLNWVKSFR